MTCSRGTKTNQNTEQERHLLLETEEQGEAPGRRLQSCTQRIIRSRSKLVKYWGGTRPGRRLEQTPRGGTSLPPLFPRGESNHEALSLCGKKAKQTHWPAKPHRLRSVQGGQGTLICAGAVHGVTLNTYMACCGFSITCPKTHLLLSLGSLIHPFLSLAWSCSHEIKTLSHWKKSYDKPRQCIKKQRCHFANKGPSSQSYGFSSSHVQM